MRGRDGGGGALGRADQGEGGDMECALKLDISETMGSLSQPAPSVRDSEGSSAVPALGPRWACMR